MEGLFSVKSDVFAFGVVLLEIISGRRNMEFFEDVNLIGHVGTRFSLVNIFMSFCLKLLLTRM